MKKLLFTLIIATLSLHSNSQQIFTEQSLNPGFDFEMNKLAYRYPRLPRNIDSFGNEFSTLGDSLLKINGTDTVKYVIPINDEIEYGQNIHLFQNEVLDYYMINTSYDSYKIASLYDNIVVFTATTRYYTFNNVNYTSRIIYRNMLCFFNGTEVTVYDEKDMIGYENQEFSFYGLSHTKDNIWVLSNSGAIHVNKTTKQFTLQTPSNSILPYKMYYLSELVSDDSTHTLIISKPKVYEYVDSVGVWKNKYPNDSIMSTFNWNQSNYVFIGRDSLYRYNNGTHKAYKIPYIKDSLGTFYSCTMADKDKCVIGYTKGFVVYDNGLFTRYIYKNCDTNYPPESLNYNLFIKVKKDSSIIVTANTRINGVYQNFQFIYNNNNIIYSAKYPNLSKLHLFEKDKDNNTHLYYIASPYFYHIINNSDTVVFTEPQNYTSITGNTYFETDENYIWVAKSSHGLGNEIDLLWRAPKLSLTTNINKISTIDNTLSVYPNPATNNIIISGLNNPKTISITNTTGQLVYSKQISIKTQVAEQINISSLKSGIYFITVKTDNGISTAKFIKE